MLPLTLAFAQGFPPPTVPSGWGVNIHFTDERPGEAAQIGAAFRFARMDFFWNAIERKRGEYDFSAYDRLVASLKRAGVRPYFILDYGNDLYQKGSPNTPESRAAFCRWVATAVARYRGRGVVWEMWNEPNISFWQPKPNVDDYIALAREVGQTVRRIAPKELFVGPATSGFDWDFLQKCLDAGLLKYWDAVSVHPYRQSEPESAVEDWLRLRAMLDRAAPGRRVPMISGEWGYSELYSGQNRERQADYIVRQYLTNLSCGVPISIFYDWKDDGTDSKETEHHFGTVLPDLSPKSAYLAALKLSKELAGFSYVTRLTQGDASRWLLLFRKGKEARLVGWTTGGALMVRLPGATRLARGKLVSGRLTVVLGSRPAVFSGPNVDAVLAWKPLPWAVMVDGPTKAYPHVTLQGGAVGENRAFGEATFNQSTHLMVRRPVGLTVVPGRDGKTRVRVDNPYDRDLTGAKLLFWRVPENGTSGGLIVSSLPVSAEAEAPPGANLARLQASEGPLFFTERRLPRFVPLPLAGAAAVAEGDSKVHGAVSASPTDEETRLEYDFAPGWRFVELRTDAGKVEGRPVEYGIWVLGNGSGDLLRMRYTDATGQTFQPDGGAIDWKGWRYVSFRLDGTGGRWGGANDGVVHPPIRITALALVDMPGGRGGKGAVTVARPTLAYGR